MSEFVLTPKLFIRIIRAEELTSTLAPYFSCRVGDNSIKTSSRYDSDNVTFNESFQLLHESAEHILFLEYYDKFGSAASNENVLIGSADIPFDQYKNNKKTEWFTIENDGKTVGKVEIEILYVDPKTGPRSPSPSPLSFSTSSISRTHKRTASRSPSPSPLSFSTSSTSHTHKRTASRSPSPSPLSSSSSSSSSSSTSHTHKRTVSRSPRPIPDETPSTIPRDAGPISDARPIPDGGPNPDDGQIPDETPSPMPRTPSPMDNTMVSSGISPLPNTLEGELLQEVLVNNFGKLYALARRKKRMTHVPIVKYVSKVGYGEHSFGKDGRVCGSMGKTQNLPLTDFYAVVDTLDPAQKGKGGIQYSVHESEVGWVPFFENGAKAGTGAHGLEAIRIELTGEFAEHFDVWYSVRLKNGWTDWVKNGKVAGIEGAPGGRGPTRVGSVAIASPIAALAAGSHASAAGKAIALNDPRHIQAIRVECMEK